MRTTQGTKYEKIDRLPANALPVSVYARQFEIKSPAYVYIKYDRYKFGTTKGKGKNKTTTHSDHPGYDLVDFHGTCYVINYQ